MAEFGTTRVKSGLAEMLKGGVIMDVVNAEQALIAEEAGAVAVMALERVPADIRVQGGVARMSDPKMIKEIMDTVTIPVMAKARIGHFVECQVCTAIATARTTTTIPPAPPPTPPPPPPPPPTPTPHLQTLLLHHPKSALRTPQPAQIYLGD